MQLPGHHVQQLVGVWHPGVGLDHNVGQLEGGQQLQAGQGGDIVSTAVSCDQKCDESCAPAAP